MGPIDAIGSLLYRALRVAIRRAVRAYFKKITLRGAENIPTSGPLLVIANHPATLTEVFLLAALLPRRLHFLAASFIFQPRIRGAFMRLCGALPVYRKQDDPSMTHRNEDMFRACYELFDLGGAVVIFPEGESKTDRRVLPLKTGAARLSLGYESIPGRRGTLRVVPVGVYFSDRTKFQSEAVLSVDTPIDLAPFHRPAGDDPQEAVRQLTAAMQQRLESLILAVPNDAIASFVRDVERLYLEELRQRRPGEVDLDLLRRTAECILHFRSIDPERVYEGWRRTVAYRRKIDALRIPDESFKEHWSTGATWRRGLRFILGASVGAGPALAGTLINVVPYRATGLLAKAVAPDGIRVSAARILAGGILFPLSWGIEATGLRVGATWSWHAIAAFLLAALPLGYFALAYVQWVRVEGKGLRVALAASRNRRLLARLRSERRALIRLFDEARGEYLARIGETSAPSGLGADERRGTSDPR